MICFSRSLNWSTLHKMEIWNSAICSIKSWNATIERSTIKNIFEKSKWCIWLQVFDFLLKAYNQKKRKTLQCQKFLKAMKRLSSQLNAFLENMGKRDWWPSVVTNSASSCRMLWNTLKSGGPSQTVKFLMHWEKWAKSKTLWSQKMKLVRSWPAFHDYEFFD